MKFTESERDSLETHIRKYVILEQYNHGDDIFYVGRCPFHVHDEKGNPLPFHVDPKNQRFRCLKPGCVANIDYQEESLHIEDFLKLVEQYGLQPLPPEQAQYFIIQRTPKQIANEESGILSTKNKENDTPDNITEQLEDEQEEQLFLFGNEEASYPRVSFSMLENYQLCPLKYKHIYIDKEKIELSSDNRRIGTSIHNTLKEFYALSIQERTDDRLIKLFRQKWSTLESDNSRWYEELYTMLSSFIAEDTKPNPIKLEEGFNYRKDKIVLFGRIDRIDQLQDGSYEVIDYKVLKHEPKNETEAANLLQSAFLYYGAKDVVGTFPSKISFFHVDTGIKTSFSPNEEDMQARFNDIKDMLEKIKLSTKFIATRNKYCSACKLFGKCPATKNEIT